MGILADIYIARDDEAVAYDSNPNLPAPDRIEMKRITPLELSTLWAIMRGVPWEVSIMQEFECLFQRDEGERVIHRLPPAMSAGLLGLAPSRLKEVASKWADTEEMKWPADNALRFLDDLIRLARRGSESGKNIYLWNSV